MDLRRSVAADRKHVLVVEDETTTRKLEAFVLEQDGYAVSEARDGADALEQLTRRHTDLVLLDLRMPGMDGWAVLEQLVRMAHVPAVIIVSGMVDIDPPPHLSGSVGRIVSKPFLPADLLVACREVLAGH